MPTKKRREARERDERSHRTCDETNAELQRLLTRANAHVRELTIEQRRGWGLTNDLEPGTVPVTYNELANLREQAKKGLEAIDESKTLGIRVAEQAEIIKDAMNETRVLRETIRDEITEKSNARKDLEAARAGLAVLRNEVRRLLDSERVMRECASAQAAVIAMEVQ